MSENLIYKEQTDRPYLTATELADRVGISDKTIRKRIANGEIQAEKRGRVWCIPQSEVDRVTEESTDFFASPTAPFRSATDRNVSALEQKLSQLQQQLEAATDRALAAENRLEQVLHQGEKFTEELSQSREREDQARQRSDTIIMQLTQQLDRAHLQLEDLRERRTVWQRVKAVFVPNST